jgi:hypothetical protein
MTRFIVLYEDELKAVLGLPDDVQDLRPDADRLSARQIRSADSPGAERGRSRRPLVERLARAVAAREVALEFELCRLQRTVLDLAYVLAASGGQLARAARYP